MKVKCLATEPVPVSNTRVGKNKSKIPALSAILLLCTGSQAAFAQPVIIDQPGAPFLEEVPKVRNTLPPAGQAVRGQNGSVFMEEVLQQGKKRPRQSPPIDYTDPGVLLDKQGKIIPLINRGDVPVQPDGSRLEIDYTPPVMYAPYSTYSGPYGYVPRYTPYGVMPVPVYAQQQNGIMAVPLGIPRSYTRSSGSGYNTQTDNFQFSGASITPPDGSSIWMQSGPSPRGRYLIPPVTQFEQKGTIQSFSGPEPGP